VKIDVWIEVRLTAHINVTAVALADDVVCHAVGETCCMHVAY